MTTYTVTFSGGTSNYSEGPSTTVISYGIPNEWAIFSLAESIGMPVTKTNEEWIIEGSVSDAILDVLEFISALPFENRIDVCKETVKKLATKEDKQRIIRVLSIGLTEEQKKAIAVYANLCE